MERERWREMWYNRHPATHHFSLSWVHQDQKEQEDGRERQGSSSDKGRDV